MQLRMKSADGLIFHCANMVLLFCQSSQLVSIPILGQEHGVRRKMHTYVLHREQWLTRPIEEVFEFFSRPENLQVITPPWLDFRMVATPQTLQAGSLIRYRLRWHALPIRWTTEISEWNPPHGFVDREVSGPYALWNHEHSFSAYEGGTTMRDRVTYALPFGILGWIAHKILVKRDVERIFDYRSQTMQRLFPA